MSEETSSNVHFLRRHFKAVLFLLFSILLVGAIYFLWQFFNRPAVGVIRAGKMEQQESFDRSQEQMRYDGKYFQFSYPGTYAEKKHDLPQSGPIKESVFFSAADIEGKKISIVVEEREGKKLEESPSFQMRMGNSKVYERSIIKWKDLDSTLFTKNSQVFEQTAFFQKDTFIVSVSLSSPIRLDNLRGDLENILKTFEWKTE